MPVVDGIVALVLLAGGLVGGVAFFKHAAQKAKRWKDRKQGERNAKGIGPEDEDLCNICHKPINPRKDLYHHSKWWHKECQDDLALMDIH